MTWQPLDMPWQSRVAGYPDTDSLPAAFGTPTLAWDYGAFTRRLIEAEAPTVIRIVAKAVTGKIGFCLVTPDSSSVASEQILITPADGETTLQIAFSPDNSPARLVIRNWDDQGVQGEVEVRSVEIGTP